MHLFAVAVSNSIYLLNPKNKKIKVCVENQITKAAKNYDYFKRLKTLIRININYDPHLNNSSYLKKISKLRTLQHSQHSLNEGY